MPWQVIGSDLPNSTKYNGELYILTLDEKKPTKVVISYIDLNEEPQTRPADAPQIFVQPTAPLPATFPARLYRVEFAGTDGMRAVVVDKAGLTSEGDFVAIDVTITNSSGTQKVTTAQRLYIPIEDPT